MTGQPGSAGVTTWLVDDRVWQDDDETPGQVAMLVDGPAVQAGLAVRIDAGAHTRWTVDGAFTELWLYTTGQAARSGS